jgi:antitoxin CcdA
MKSVPDLIEALGGHQQLARALRVPPGTVSSWKSRRAVPARVWTALVAHARKRQLQGIDLETLASLHSPSKRRAAKVEAQGRAANGRRRTRVKIRIDKDLLDEAANLGIDVNTLADDVLRQAIKKEKDRRWQAEHADVIAWYNEHIERDGIFGEEWRTF